MLFGESLPSQSLEQRSTGMIRARGHCLDPAFPPVLNFPEAEGFSSSSRAPGTSLALRRCSHPLLVGPWKPKPSTRTISTSPKHPRGSVPIWRKSPKCGVFVLGREQTGAWGGARAGAQRSPGIWCPPQEVALEAPSQPQNQPVKFPWVPAEVSGVLALVLEWVDAMRS